MNFEIFMEFFMLIINHVYLFLIPVIILISGGATPNGAADYGAFALASVFYLVFSVSLSTPFIKLMYVSQNGKLILNGIERMDKVLDTPPLTETASPKTVAEYSVSFDHVTFTYSASGRPAAHTKISTRARPEGTHNGEGEAAAIQDVNFTARQGEVTALVGPSGSGKSTLAHLIPRFYEVGEGRSESAGWTFGTWKANTSCPS
jgi:ATP-binding cassette subfamily B protein